MGQTKKIYITLIALFSLSLTQTTLASEFFDAPYEQDEFDVFLDDPDVNHFLDENEFQFVRRNPGPAEIFELLTEEGLVHAFVDLFKEDIYLRTHPLTRRDILDLPMGMLDKNYNYNNWIIGTEIFWNNTDRSYFSRKCDFISAYLALDSGSFLAKLDAIAKEVQQFGDFDFDPADIFILFKNGTVQERQFGFLLHGRKSWRKWRFSWKFPFYYLERNFWFTEEEQEAIEKEFGALEEEEQERFQERYMISDKLGFGDLRFMFDHPIREEERFDTRLGVLFTIPTAWGAKGLKGTHFVECPRPELDLAEVIEIALDALDDPAKEEEVFDILQNFAYSALDRMSLILLEEPLGNRRHFGAGIFIESITPLDLFIKRPWASNINWKSFISLEYLFPAKEKRFFVERIDPRLFDMRDFTITDSDDPVQKTRAEDNMAFLSEQFVDRFFPHIFETWVHPGLVFRWSGKAVYQSARWGFHIGTDMWVKTEESFGDIDADDDLFVDRLRIARAKRMLGYQTKIFGSLLYKTRRSKRDWTISLNADGTILHSGIGSDYTVSLNLEVDF
ncbi:hypothetical protein ACFLX2_00990 [Candidatus Dependentiae bacterium]